MRIPAYLTKIIGTYLQDIVIIYDSDEGMKEYYTTSGIPQGFVFGSNL